MNMKQNKNNPLITRLNVLFFLVFVLFAILIIRLGVIQLVNGESYSKEANTSNHKTVKTSTPRGKIYDRNQRLIVDNEAVYSLVYTKERKTTQKEMLETAKKLAEIVSFKTNKLTERDLKDYWIITRPEEALGKLKEDELHNEKMSDQDLYKLQLERITTKDLATINGTEKETAAIFREMNKSSAYVPQIIKNKGVTKKEMAIVVENMHELPGIDVTVDWNRKYPHGSVFRSVLGNVSSAEEGLPSENLDYYLSRDYRRNDRVGKSQLELQYEDVLKGEKSVIEVETNKAGEVISEKVVSKGKVGNNLILTIDIELQKKIEEVLEKELIIAKNNGGGEFLNSAYAVVMNPQNGEVLAMSGKKFEKANGKTSVIDHALGTINSTFEMGSAVKGATILTGLDKGIITPGQVLLDEPIYLKGTKVKKSYTTMGYVNDLQALQRSSNVYMFKIAMGMLGKTYHKDMKLPMDPEAFQTFRNYFNQFGLGVKTGIDLPNEASGLPGIKYDPGYLLDFTIGQYDTYTPIQLAQYISTIANGGYRLQPHLVKEVTNQSSSGDDFVNYAIEPKVLNRIEMKKSDIDRVREGFRMVYQEPQGLAYSYFSQPPYNSYKLAGKTGTAESFYYDPIKKYLYTEKPTYNLTLVGYAPHENPEMAFAVVVPNTKTDTHPVNKRIGQGIVKAYFDLKNEE